MSSKINPASSSQPTFQREVEMETGSVIPGGVSAVLSSFNAEAVPSAATQILTKRLTGAKRRREEELRIEERRFSTFRSPSPSSSPSSPSRSSPTTEIERRIVNHIHGKVRIFERGEHEKRSVLSTIMTGVDELQTYKERLSTYPELLKIFDELAQKSAHLFRLYNQALDGMSVKTSTHALTLQKEAIGLVRSLVAKKGIRLTFEFPQDLSLMISDMEKDLFQQLILNFVRNAVLHAQGATQVTVRMTAKDYGAHYELLISVEDDGLGMTDAVLNQLFHSDERVQSSSMKEGSSGIGNAVCREFATSLNPWYNEILTTVSPLILPAGASLVREYLTPIGVYRLQRGTCCWFTVQLPRGIDLPQPTPPTPMTPLPQAPSFHARALLIDDHLINLKIPQRMLLSLGYKADTAQTGQEGVAKAIVEDYDVIFIDMQINGSKPGFATGEEVVLKLRGLGVNSLLVAFTADSLQSTRKKCVDLGMRFLLKPFTKKDLEVVLPMLDQGGGKK